MLKFEYLSLKKLLSAKIVNILKSLFVCFRVSTNKKKHQAIFFFDEINVLNLIVKSISKISY